ncbi:excinuclease ABC subunit UvrC [Candidatus Spongiihabitans sp.]|uniref:excinuclease ABC subunit UvrC n=1 Tax=Candidatus Spongiihabitans sp. TaxID=3101308 RepID=UPI003C7B16E8
MTEADNNFDRKAFLDTASEKPGVYIFIDRCEKTLYVGKASNLKKRLQSYFRSAGLSPKTRLMVSKIQRAQTQQTRTESEALLLENNLIKAHKPRYNISLRDDKSFPYIRLSEQDRFPRFSFYRGRRPRPHQYYGPYPNAAAVREMLAQIHKIFRLRQCNDAFFRNRSRPCLQYQIKRCSAPCVGRIGRENYLDDVRQAKAMLGGRDFALLDELAGKMERASTKLDYETAAHYRDRIALLRRATAKQYVSSGRANADVVTVALESDKVCFGVVSIRHGRNLGGRFHIQKNPLDLAAAELLEAFLPQNYFGSTMPAEILLSEKIASRSALQQVFSIENKSKVAIKHRCRAHRARWIESARVNTADHLRAHLNQRSQIDAQFAALTDLLSLDEVPARIECFDISHTMGERAVGSCVVFDRQGAVKSDYRKFNIAGIEPGDDYAAMQQTLERRYKRVLQDDGKLPDLVIIDGGKGQLSVAARVFEELQILGSVVLLAVSKGRARRPCEEQLHLFGSMRAIMPGAIMHSKGSAALHLIQRVRDEAHRFALSGHRQRRAKARTDSPLQQIEGVGAARRRNLLRYFGGLREVTRAGEEDLAKVPGISSALAQRIYNQLHD